MAVELTYRKFPKIYRLEQEEANSKHEGVASLLEQNKAGNYYVATEKIDGANSCIEVLKRDGKIDFAIYSHRQRLSEDNTLRGFYEYAQEVLIPKLMEFYKNIDEAHDYLYGEWLVSHRVEYQQKMYNHWYFFSFYDDLFGHEYNFFERTAFADRVGLRQPNVVSMANYTLTKEDINAMVGRSMITKEPDHGEGIVIECDGVRAKVVSDKFKETRKQKKPQPSQTESEKFIDETITEARITKMIEKFKDENLLPDIIDFEHFGDIARPLANALWNDVIEEEGSNAPELFDAKKARKRLNKIIPKYVRELIENEMMSV
ncbi:MAG: RNA ligase family protein [Limosilactobacillus reuteri]|nr:RNA ligase family protein [Limosilactobacillus reuteri]